MYLSYAYGGAADGEWGNWATRLHKVTLSLSDAPLTDDSRVQNADFEVERKPARLIPEITTVKAEHQVYTIKKSTRIQTMALDSDGFVFPVFFGTTYDGYDDSVIRIIGNRVIAVREGTTRVRLHWHGLSGDFVVHVEQ